MLSRDEHDPCALVRPAIIEEMFKLHAQIWQVHAGSQVIETTKEHPFYVANHGWRAVHSLQRGDLLVGPDGELTPVDRIVETNRSGQVYNMRIRALHTFFVGTREWGFSVWVHNACLEIVTRKGQTILRILNKFPVGSAEASQLQRFVKAWNEEILKAGGSLTGRTLTPAEVAASEKWARAMNAKYPKRLRLAGKVAGHVPDAAAGGPQYPGVGRHCGRESTRTSADSCWEFLLEKRAYHAVELFR